MATTRFSKIQWGDGLTVTPDVDDPTVIRVDGTGGPAGATGPAGPTGATGATGATGPGVPTGGTTGQALEKASGTDYDTHWVTIGGGTVAHLDDIGDVTAPSPADADVLYWEASTGKWQSRQAVLMSLAAAKGDLIAATGSSAFVRLPVGSNGQILTADSTQTAGIKWSPAAGGMSADPLWDAKGDLAVASAADTASRLAVGSNGQVLTADSTQTLGVKWAAAAAAAGTNMLAQLYGPMPGSVGSAGMYRVPYKAGSAVTYTLTRASLHLETAGSTTTTVLLEKATPSGGAFLAVLVATLTLAASATQADVTTSLGTVTSGDLIRWRWTALGTGAQSFHAQLEGNV
jgi:hypothetical protein